MESHLIFLQQKLFEHGQILVLTNRPFHEFDPDVEIFGEEDSIQVILNLDFTHLFQIL